MLSLLPVLMMQAAAPAPLPADLADARCIFVFGFVGSRGTPEQAEQAKRNTMYFLGRLRGRNTSSDLGKLLAFAGNDARRSGVHAQQEGARCERVVQAAGAALVAGAAAAKSTP